MQSFSPFKPVLSGTPAEIKVASFAMWLRANAFSVKRPFDRMRWKTARPWLTFAELRYQLKLYRERSLGSILLGSVTLKDADVERAMKYEAYATRQLCKSDVRAMILEFYDFSRSHSIKKQPVLNNINKEFMFLDRGFVKFGTFNWKNATREFSSRGYLTLKPKINEHEMATLIWHVFKPGKTARTVREIFEKIAPTLNVLGHVIHEHSPILRRALLITSCKLDYLNKRDIVQKIVDKYYVPYELGKESLKRLQFVVNRFCQIPEHDPVWNFIRLDIVPKHDWNLPGYEEAYSAEYDDPPEVFPEQEPFMRFRLPYQFIRKKQKIPWKIIMDKCERKKGTDKRTLSYVNEILKFMGFTPLSFCHPEFDFLKVQGLRLSTESFRSFFPEQHELPDVLPQNSDDQRTACEQSDGGELSRSGEKSTCHSSDTCASSPCSEISRAPSHS